MSMPSTPETALESSEIQVDEFDEEMESSGDHHRMAAHHFAAAAKHHLAAALADDEGDEKGTATHALKAYRHQLNGVQYAEIAVIDNESLDDELDEAVLAD